MEANVSVRLPVDGAPNLRDLGGMRTGDGRRIRPGMLLRAGALDRLRAQHVRMLSGMGLDAVYDMRNASERSERPDAEIPGSENIHLPIFQERVSGITREERSRFERNVEFVETFLADPRGPFRRMQGSYRTFVSSPFSRGQYSFLIRDLLRRAGEAREKGESRCWLWHCAAGKDRTGFGAAIIEHMLGVDEESIRQDYLLTNRYASAGLMDFVGGTEQQLREHYGEGFDGILAAAEEPFRMLIDARIEYLDAAMDEAQTEYGSFDGFILDGLRVTNEEQERMRELFLE